MSASEKTLYAPSPVVNRGQPTHLGVNPKTKEIVFGCGNNVFMYDLETGKTWMYAEHQHAVTVGRISSNGFWAATGDVAGKVRVWSVDNPEHILKVELPVLGGAIRDMAFSEDGQRLVACGEGTERFGAVFMADSGSSVGEISGHAKPINSCDFKQTRPYRVATASEDFAVNWFEGPPFKYKSSHKDFTRFANCVRFAPDGSKMLAVSSDKKGIFYDGKTGEKLGYELNGDVHKAGIYAIAWSADSSQVLTASADKTVKLWDASNGACITTFSPGGDKPGTDDQQLGVVWHGGEMVSLSLNGALNFLDPTNPSKPKKVVRAHNKFVTALAYDQANAKIYSASFDALTLQWDVASGMPTAFGAGGHANQVNRLRLSGGKLVSASMDDTVRITDAASASYDGAQVVSLDGPVLDCAAHNGAALVAAVTKGKIHVIKGGAAVSATVASGYEPTCVAISTDGAEVAVGGSDNKIRLFTLSGDSLTAGKVLGGHRGPVSRVAFAPNGSGFASADKNRDIFLWDRAAGTITQKGWEFHTAAIRDLAWAPDSAHLASGALDGNVFVWSVEEPTKRIQIKMAHKGGVNGVDWCDNSTLVSVGQDCCVKTWTVNY